MPQTSNWPDERGGSLLQKFQSQQWGVQVRAKVQVSSQMQEVPWGAPTIHLPFYKEAVTSVDSDLTSIIDHSH